MTLLIAWTLLWFWLGGLMQWFFGLPPVLVTAIVVGTGAVCVIVGLVKLIGTGAWPE